MEETAETHGRRSGLFVIGIFATAWNVFAFFFADFGLASQDVLPSTVVSAVKILVLLLVASLSYAHRLRESTVFWSMMACAAAFFACRCTASFGLGGFPALVGSYAANGAMAALALVSVGLMLVTFGGRDARRIIAVGFALAAAFAIAAEALPSLSEQTARLLSLLLYLAFASAYYFRARRQTALWPPLRMSSKQKTKPVAVLLSMGLPPFVSYIASIILAFVVGLFEAYLLFQGRVYGLGALLLSFALICCCIPLLFDAPKHSHALFDKLLLVVCVASIITLPAFLMFPAYDQSLFSILFATIVFLQIPIFIFLVDASTEKQLSPAYLFGLFPAGLALMHTIGRLTSWVAFPHTQAGESYSYLVVGALTVFAVAAVFVVAVLLVRKPKEVDRSAPETTVTRSDALDALCNQFGLTEREREIVELYAAGRSAPVIGEHLHLATSTVKTHIGNVYAKTGTSNKQELLDVLRNLEGRDI